MSFRPALAQLRTLWEQEYGLPAAVGDGFYLVAEMHAQRGRDGSSPQLQQGYQATIDAISHAVQ